jgi:DNA polymerase-1
MQVADSRINSSTLKECIEYIDGCLEVCLDIETSGLNINSYVLMIQVGDSKNQFVIDLKSMDRQTKDSFMSMLGNILSQKVVIGHNLKFDLKFLKHYFNWELPEIYDTCLAEKLLNCGLTVPKGYNGLEDTVMRYSKIALDKTISEQFLTIGSKPFTTTQILYGAMDIMYLQEIRDKQRDKIKSLGIENVVKLEFDLVKVLIDIELTGILFDVKLWNNNIVDNIKKLGVCLDELNKIILTDPRFKMFVNTEYQLSLFYPPTIVDINWSSPPQVKEVLEIIDPYLESTDSKKISKYIEKEPIIKALIEFRKIKKELTTYGQNFLDILGKDGKIRTTYSQILNTGRMSSGDKDADLPNLQNIPRKDKFRNAFIARPGYKIAAIDFTGQEVAIATSFSKEPTWIKALEESKDIHSMVAEMMFKEKWKELAEDNCAYYNSVINKEGQLGPYVKCECKKHKPLRFVAKTINFGAIYGMEAHKLYEQVTAELPDMGYTMLQARSDMAAFHDNFKYISRMIDKFGNYAQKNGHIFTKEPYKRYRFFSFPNNSDTRREAGNMPIQATGANMIKLAMIRVYDYLKNSEFDCKMVHTVHDELVFEVKEEDLECLEDIKNIMESTGREFIDVPISCSIDIDNFWKK